MKILAIDTSCDDTCISLIKAKNHNFKILSNVVSSQVKLHAKYGGVYPFLAKREHQKNLPIVLKKATKEVGISKFAELRSSSHHGKTGDEAKPQRPSHALRFARAIDLIGVTIGPGLEPCLWTGVNFAIELARKLNLKIIPVNHIEAHILANWLPTSPGLVEFPAVCLVVSGGHTQLILMRKIGDYKLVGETRDDAAGECFDKAAKILGLGYPGGPAIDKQAEKIRRVAEGWRPKFDIKLPRPMISQKNYDLSFSGLKTAVLYDFRSRASKIRKSKIYIQEMAKEVQQAIIDVLISKTFRAAKEFRVKTIILGGGVAASAELRNQFKTKCLTSDLKFLVPPKNLCTDNAAMVGIAAYFHRAEAFKNWKIIEANANLKI